MWLPPSGGRYTSRLSQLPPEGGSHESADKTQTITRHFTPQEQQAIRYEYVPFTIPAGTTTITIGYSYDKAGGTNVIDLGLFEPGPLTLGTKAFRGWSGGSQASVTVGVGEASPGYWPGPLPAGEWHAMLGLYKVAPAGVDVQVTIAMSDAPSAGQAPAIRAPVSGALRTGQAWYAGAMHSHTVHSDGVLTPEQLVAKAHGENLDFLVITDHNTTSQQRAPLDQKDVLVINGEEVTTPGGHFNVWGLSGDRAYIDFRILPGDPAIRTAMNDAHARGALVSINHPISDCFACTWTHEIPPGVNAIEIQNGPATMRLQQMALWDALLREGRHITAVGESDWHRGPLAVAMPSVRVWAPELSQRAILDAVRDGHVVVMANGTLQAPEVIVKAGNTLARVGDEVTSRAGDPIVVKVTLPGRGYEGARVDLVWRGEVVDSATWTGEPIQFQRYPAFGGYARVHVVGTDGILLAVTNPVFVKVAPR